MNTIAGLRRGHAGAPGAAMSAPQAPRPTSSLVLLLRVVLGGALCLLLVLSLLSRSAADPAFTTSGLDGQVRNWLGLPGAWLADVALLLFGFSAWWLVLVGLRQWLSAVAEVWRRRQPVGPATAAPPAPGWRVTLGLALLLPASTALEWTRIYTWEERLPGPAGGILGHLLGPWSQAHLGFAGSGALWIALMLLALPLALRFSWVRSADAIGGWIDGARVRHTLKREQAEDVRIGEQAMREKADDHGETPGGRRGRESVLSGGLCRNYDGRAAMQPLAALLYTEPPMTIEANLRALGITLPDWRRGIADYLAAVPSPSRS